MHAQQLELLAQSTPINAAHVVDLQAERERRQGKSNRRQELCHLHEHFPRETVIHEHSHSTNCAWQASAADRPIKRGMAGAGLLAHVLTNKYCDHLPLYRQSHIYRHVGVDLHRSTLADCVGQTRPAHGD